MNNMDSLEDWMDDNVPEEVLHSREWDTRLLPDLNSLNKLTGTYQDVVEDVE